METQHWVETALDCDYISPIQAASLNEKSAEIGRMLGGMIAKAETFCNPAALSVREEQASYLITPEN